MPSAKVLTEKQQIVADLAEKLSASPAGVLVDYKGITVADDTKLRANMRKAGVEYAVVKNTLTKLAAEKAGLTGLDEVLNGTTSLAMSNGDPLIAAKLVAEFAEKSKTFKIKCGYFDGKVISAEEVMALAKIPSKEVLLAQLLGLLTSGLRGLAVGLKAVADKNAEGAPAAEAETAPVEAAPAATAPAEAAEEAPAAE